MRVPGARVRCLCVLLLLSAVGAPEAVASDGVLALGGSLRGTTLVSGVDAAGDSGGLTFSALRLTAAGDPLSWLDYEVHGVQILQFTTMSGSSAFAALGQGAASGPAAQARLSTWRYDWVQQADLRASFFPDRLQVRLRLPIADVTVGRQAVSFGKAFFWNPLDVFLPFSAASFDRDYKPGVDALRVDIPWGDFSGITAVVSLGRGESARYQRASGIARVYTTLFDWDVAAQGGKVFAGYTAAAAAAGEVGPLGLAVRAEVSYVWRDGGYRETSFPPRPEGLTAVVGLGRPLTPSFDVQFEYLFGGALSGTLAQRFSYVAAGFAQQASTHVLGALARSTFFPLLQATVACMQTLDDPSTLLQAYVVYSAADEVDVVAGGLVTWGRRPAAALVDSASSLPRSEFGTYPAAVFVETKVYF